MKHFKESIQRISTYIDELSKFSFPIGKNPTPGVTRLAFSPQESGAFDWAERKLKEFGYECRNDAFLNFHAVDPRNGGKRILVGTHLDTVKNGGRFDGTVGLVFFLEVLHLQEENRIRFALPVDVVIFRAEESTMFKEALLGSKVATGYYDLEKLKDIQFGRDEDLFDAMIHFGYLQRVPPGEDIPEISLVDILFKHTDEFRAKVQKGCWLFPYDKEKYESYFEVHIEQGKVLETKKKDLGVVTSIRAPLRVIFTLQGTTDHSGATPMNGEGEDERFRQDALCATSECIIAIEEICESEHRRGVDIVGTVGEISIPYSGINKVPGRCKYSLDLRSSSYEERQRIYNRIIRRIEKICERRQVKLLEPEETENTKPVSLRGSPKSVEIQDEIESTIRRLGYSSIPIASGAGHDAMQIAKSEIPTCMLFIPCKEGISHSPDEYAKAEDIFKASRVLLTYFAEN